MKEYPFPGYEYPFNKPVIFMFPMILPNTIGIYYGYEEHFKNKGRGHDLEASHACKRVRTQGP